MNEELKMYLPWMLIGAIIFFNFIYYALKWISNQLRRPPVVMPDAEQLRIQIIHDATEFKRKLIFDLIEKAKRDVGSIMSEKRLVSDGFVCLIERMRREGKLSDIRAEWYYKQASLHLGLDTAPGTLPVAGLKAAIKTRLYHYHDLYFRPVPFPDRRWSLKDFSLSQGKPPWE